MKHSQFVYWLLILLCFSMAQSTAVAHDVKDPVCRMNVDNDTTPYRMMLGNKTFYFCSPACENKFKKSPSKYIAIAGELLKAGRRQYVAELSISSPAVPQKPINMAFAIRYADTKTLVKNFEVVHEKLIHLVMVRDDLSWFEHQHPHLDKDGIFRFTWAFPRSGRYFLYADFTPSDGDNQIKRMVLDIGKNVHPSSSTNLIPDVNTEKAVNSLYMNLALVPKTFHAGRQTLMTYTFSEHGKPVTDMQPFIGAMGHLFAISDDGKTVLHTHVLHGVAPGSYEATMLSVMQAGDNLVVTPEMVSKTGPTFTFKVTLPKPGVYKVWAQFMRHNDLVTVPYVIHVEK